MEDVIKMVKRKCMSPSLVEVYSANRFLVTHNLSPCSPIYGRLTARNRDQRLGISGLAVGGNQGLQETCFAACLRGIWPRRI